MKRTFEQRIGQILAQMTLDEKLAQMGSHWIYEIQTDGGLDQKKVAEKLSHGIGQISRLAGASTLHPRAAAQTANQIQKYLRESTRLAIPAIVHEECCAGVMGLGGTTYPQMIGLAAAFRPELAEAMTTEIRAQMRAIGAHQGLAPVLDVARDPRWGRTEETFGEDALLASQYGTHYIRGLQGKELSHGVMATAKHFVGHSLSQGGLNCAPSHIGERELWDVFMLPFQAAIQSAGVATVMNAYPELDGEVVAASQRILTQVLRETLGFDGLLVSDYFAVEMIHNFHHMAADPAEAAALALKAGIEVEAPSFNYYDTGLKEALASGTVNLELIDRAVARHLQKKFELGLFDDPFVDEGRAIEVFETPPQRSLALRIACQSMVLLTNDGTLPLKKSIGTMAIKTLAVVGPNADAGRNLLCDYSYASILESLTYNAPPDSNFPTLDVQALAEHQVKVPSILAALRAKAPDINFLYAKGCDTMSADESGFAEAVRLAGQADAVILVLGDKAGMTPQCTCGEFRDSADLRLPGRQVELAEAIFAVGKPVVLVLVNGRPLAIPQLVEKASAVLEAWLPGEEGGAAVADVLFGDANPGGKLPITFPRTAGQLPIFYNHKPSAGKSHWFIDYVSESVKPLFPFGHGLSYTKFDYRDLSIGSAKVSSGESLEIACTVENSGPVTGDEVVQLYVCDVAASSPRPVKELKGFRRLTLMPGESRKIVFSLPVDILAYYDLDLNLVVEPGTIAVMIGSSSEDIRLKGEFEIAGAGKVRLFQRVFTCPVEVR